MKRARQDEYVNIVKATQVKLLENKEEWARHPRLTDFLNKAGYQMEENDIKEYQYTKMLNDAPYSKFITISIDDGVVNVNISEGEPGRSSTFGDEFSEDKEAIVYIQKVESGQITEEIKRDWGDAYQKMFKAKQKENKNMLMANSQHLKDVLEGKKKKKKKSKKTDPKRGGPYGVGYAGWGMGLQDWSPDIGDAVGDGGGDGGGE